MSHQQSPYSLHGAPCGTQCSEGLMSGTAALVYLNPPQQHSVLPNGVVGQGDVNYAADNGQHQQNRTIYHFGQVKPDRILNTNKELGHPQKLDANDSNACEFPSRDRGVTNTGVVGNENSGGNTQDSRQYVGNNSNLQTMSGNQNAVGGVKAKSSTEQFYSENAATIANCQVRQESLTNRGGPHVQFEKPGNVNNFQVVNSELDQIENKYSHPDSSVSVQASFAQSRDDTNRNLSFGQGPAADYIEAVDKKPGGAHASNAECMERSDTYIDKDDFNHSDQLPQLTNRDYRLYKARAESPSRRREFNEHSNDARENAQRFNGHDAHFWSPLDFHVKDIRTSNSDSFSYIPRLHRGLRPTGGTARTLFSSGSKSSNEDDEDVLISNPRSHLRTNTTRSIMSRISPKTPQPPPSTSGYNPVHGSGASTDFSPLSPGCNSISLTQRRPSSGLSLEELDERCHLLGYSHTALFCAVMNRNEELAAINGSIMGELRQGSQLLRDGFKEYREMGTEIKESLEKNRLAMEDMQEELKSLQQVVRGSTKTGEFGVNPDSYQTSSGRGSFIAGDETRKRNGNGSNTNYQTTNIFPPAHQAQTVPNVLVSTAPLSQELSEGVQQTTANLSPPGRMKTTAGHSNSVAQNLQQPFDSVLPYQTINLQTLPHNALQMPVLGQFPNSPGLQLQTQTQMQPQSLYQPSVLPPMLSNNHLQISANGLNSTMFPETNSQTNCLAQYQNWIAGDQLSSRHSNQDENRPNLQSQRQPENNQTSGYNIEDMNTQRNLESIHSIVTHAALLRDAIHDPNRLTTEVSSQTLKPQTDGTSMQTVRLKKEDTSMQTVRLKKEDTSVQTLESSTHSKKTQTAKKTKNVSMQTTNKSGHHVATQVSIQAENIAREGDNSKPPNPIDTNSQSVPPSISLIELDDTPCLEPTKHYTESLLADMLSLQTSFGNVDVPDYSSPFKQSPKVVNTSETEVLQATSSTAVNHTGPNRTFHQRHGESYQINEQPSNIMWPNKIPEERQRLETHCSDKNFEACVDASGDKRFSAKGLGVLVHETSISKLCPMNNNRSAETSGAARALQAPLRDDTNDAMAKKSEHRPPAIKENTNNNARDLGHSHREKVIENKAATNADREAREQTRTSSETRAFFKEQSDEKAQASSDNTLPSDSKCTENTPEQSSPVTPAKHAPSDKEIEPSAGVQLSELEQSETPTSHFQYVTESEEPGRHDVTRAPKSDTQSDQKAQKGRSTKQLVEDRLGDEAAAAVKNKPEAKATVKNRSDAFFKPESKNAPTPDLDRACWANLPSNCTTLEENKPCTDSQTLTDVGTANKISKTATLGTKCKAQTTGAGRHRASEEDQTKHVYPNPNPECFTAVPVNNTSKVQTEVQPNRSAETSGAARALQAPRRDDTNDAMAKKSEHRPPAIKENTNNNARDLGHSHREKVIENKAATNADREAREQTRTSSETRAFFKEQSDEKAQASSDNTLPSDSKCTENTPEQSSPVTPAKHAPSDKEIEPSAGVQLSELEQSETPTSHFQYVTESEEPGRHDVTRAPKSDTQSDQKAQKGRSTKQLVEDRLGDEAAAAVKNKSDILVEPESKNVPTPDLDRAWYADLPSNDVYRNQHGQSYHAERNTDNSVQKVDTKEYKQIPKNIETFTSFKMNSVQKSLLGTCANVTLPRSQSLPCLSPSNQRTPMVQRERHTVRENQDIFHNGEKNKQTENLDREHQQKYIGESKSFSLDEPIGYAEELIENSEIRTYDYKPEEVRRAFEEAADKSSVKIEDENSHLDSSHKSSLPQINLQDVKTLLEVLSAFALASFVSMQNTYHGSLINPIYDKNNQNESGQSQRMSNQEITNHLEPEMKAKVQTSATQTVTEKESLQDDYNADDQSQFYESLNESSAAFGDNDNNKFDDSLRDQNKSNKSEQVESTSCLQKACSETIISENFTISVTPKRLPPIKLTTRGEMIPAGHSQPIQTIVAEDADSQAEEEIPQISGSIGSPNADRDLSTLIHASDAGADNKSDVLRRDHREAPVSCKATYESATSDHLTTNVGKPEIDTHSELSKFSTISPENANHARSDPKKIVGKMQVAVKSQHNEETQEESKHVDASTEDNERGIVSNNAATKLTTTMQEPLSSHQARLDHTMDSNVLGAINSSTNTCQSTMCDHTLSGTAIERADEQLNDQTSADHDTVVNHHVVPDAHIRYDHTTKSNINDDIGHGKPTTDKHETITSYPAHASNTTNAVADTQVVEATREDCGSSESFNAQTEDVTCNIQLDKPALRGGAHAVPEEITSKGQPILKAITSNTKIAVDDTQVVEATREDCGSSESFNAQTEDITCNIQLDKPAPKGGAHAVPQENTSKGQPSLEATASNTTFAVADTQVVKSTREDCGSSESLDAQTEHVKCDIQLNKPAPKGGTHTIPEENTSKGQPILGATASNTSGKKAKEKPAEQVGCRPKVFDSKESEKGKIVIEQKTGHRDAISRKSEKSVRVTHQDCETKSPQKQHVEETSSHGENKWKTSKKTQRRKNKNEKTVLRIHSWF